MSKLVGDKVPSLSCARRELARTKHDVVSHGVRPGVHAAR